MYHLHKTVSTQHTVEYYKKVLSLDMMNMSVPSRNPLSDDTDFYTTLHIRPFTHEMAEYG